MLLELRVKNVAVISDLRLEFRKGLTILSGDEGVGKSLLVDALCLLTGGKSSASLIRSGAKSALVEGIFDIGSIGEEIDHLLQEAGLEAEPDGSLIICREIQEQGRSTARIGGRAVPVSLLKQLGRYLVDIHGQTEQLSLLNRQRQLEILDGYGRLLATSRGLETKTTTLREKSRQLGELARSSSRHERELLEFQVAEIDRAGITPGEEESLEREWHILQRSQELKEYCYTAYGMLYEDDRGAAGMAHQAARALRRAVSIDPELQTQVERISAAAVELEEAAQELSAFADGTDDSPGRLQQVEERLAALRHFKHKYEGSLEDVLKYSAEARQKLSIIDSCDGLKEELETECRNLLQEATEIAEKLSNSRKEAAASLVALVNSELAEVGMPWAKFEIQLIRETGDSLQESGKYAFNRNSLDKIQFLAGTNPGEPLRPLSDIASGGETSRFMLALKSALRESDAIPTIVFDEIDAGVGGRNAGTVGKKLAMLAAKRQVVCITHLPQIACFGDSHFRISKDVSTAHSVASFERLDEVTRVQELASMLGGTRKPMLDSAEDLLVNARADA